MDFVVHRQNTKVFVNINMSTSNTSAPIPANSFSLYALQAWWTGFTASASDLIIIEATNDISDTIDSNKVYTQIDAFIPVGTTGSVMLNVEKAGYAIIRIRYVTSGATGTLNTILNGKIM